MTAVTHKHFQLVSNHLQAVSPLCRMSPTQDLSSKFLEA